MSADSRMKLRNPKVKIMESDSVKQADVPVGPRGLQLGIICVLAFLLALVWDWAAIEIAARWYYVINWLLHDSVRMIDEQPLWGKILQEAVYLSPRVGLLVCLYLWGVKRRIWLVPVAFFLGIVVYDAYVYLRFLEAMKNFR